MPTETFRTRLRDGVEESQAREARSGGGGVLTGAQRQLPSGTFLTRGGSGFVRTPSCPVRVADRVAATVCWGRRQRLVSPRWIKPLKGLVSPAHTVRLLSDFSNRDRKQGHKGLQDMSGVRLPGSPCSPGRAPWGETDRQHVAPRLAGEGGRPAHAELAKRRRNWLRGPATWRRWETQKSRSVWPVRLSWLVCGPVAARL